MAMELYGPKELFTSQVSVTLLALSFIAVFVFLYRKRHRNYPPGPTGVPVFGYLPFLGSQPHKAFTDVGKKYGCIFSVQLGPSNVVVIGDWKVAKEALTSQSFLGRPPHTTFKMIPDEMGMATNNGPEWQEERKFSITAFKNLTVKINKLEETIQEDLSETIGDLEASHGQPVFLRKHLTESSINHIWYLLFGERILRQDPMRKTLRTLLTTMSEYFGFASACGFVPWLAKVFVAFRIAGYDKAVSIFKDANEMFGNQIEIRREKLDEVHLEQFAVSYLQTMKRKEENKEPTSLTLRKLRGTLQAFFLGGAETTRSSIEWALLTAAAYPEVQKKIQKEVDNAVGRGRRPIWADRANMPFTMAVVYELQRWKTLVPIGPPRYAVEDCTLDKYHIPEGTTILFNLWALHNDPKYWEKPEEFRPERFLSEDGTKVIKRESYSPFTLGRRKCPGDEMALTIIFIYLSTILQRFDVDMPEGTTADVDSCCYGLTFQPVIQGIRFLPRQ